VRAAVVQTGDSRKPVVEQVDFQLNQGSQTLHLTVMPLNDQRAMVIVRDVTLETSLRLALVDSRQRYKDFVEISTDFAWEVSPEMAFAFVSPRGGLGYSADALIRLDPKELVLDFASGTDAPFFTSRRLENSEVWLKRADGRAACVVVSATPLVGADGSWQGARGVCRDVTESREREATLARVRNRERVLTRIVRSFRDEVNPENMLAAAAETLARGLGAECCQVFRVKLDKRSSTGGAVAPEFEQAGKFGEGGEELHLPILESIGHGAGAAEVARDNWQILASPSRHRGELNGAVVLWRRIERGTWTDDDRLLIGDIANQIGITIEQLSHHERVLRLSRTDAMTGLLNRAAFMDGLNRQLHRLERDPDDAALMYVDLDNFKAVNDTRGHQAGDEALLKLRDILVQQTRPTDMVARLGGDEFAVFLGGANKAIAEKRAQKFLEETQQLESYSASPDKPLGMSIGIAVLAPKSGEKLDALLARADEAMYSAKKGGKGRFAIAPEPVGGGS
jgi:diguanylate cyclase (GGDEF)-like protein/PAS domain S-box-containing protein